MRTGSWILAAVASAMLWTSSPAWAGEAKVGAEPLDTDGSGKLTKAGQAAAVSEIEAQPGDEVWVLHLWAKIDNGADGPLYIEIGKNRDGRRLVSKRESIDDYAADKYVSATVELDRSDGFKPDQVVEVAFVQNMGGKDAIKATVEVTLKASSAPPPAAETPEPEEEDEDGEDEDDDGEDKDDDATPSPEPTPATPPPVESGDKKGCTVGGHAPTPSAALLLLCLGAVATRRRR